MSKTMYSMALFFYNTDNNNFEEKELEKKNTHTTHTSCRVKPLPIPHFQVLADVDGPSPSSPPLPPALLTMV